MVSEFVTKQVYTFEFSNVIICVFLDGIRSAPFQLISSIG